MSTSWIRSYASVWIRFEFGTSAASFPALLSVVFCLPVRVEPEGNCAGVAAGLSISKDRRLSAVEILSTESDADSADWPICIELCEGAELDESDGVVELAGGSGVCAVGITLSSSSLLRILTALTLSSLADSVRESGLSFEVC